MEKKDVQVDYVQLKQVTYQDLILKIPLSHRKNEISYNLHKVYHLNHLTTGV